MTAITAVLGLSVPPRSKWVVYKHNFSVTGLQSQGGWFQSKGHKFSAKQSRLVKKKKRNPLQTLGSRWEKKWKDVLTNGAHKLLLCLTNTSFMRAQPTFRPDRQIESPLFYFKLLQMTTGDVIWIYSASLFICFLFGFFLFFVFLRAVADRWREGGPPGELHFITGSQNAIKLQKQAFLALWLQCWAKSCASLDHLHVWQKGKEAAERERDLFLYLFILFYCYFAKLFWHIYG